MRPDVSRLGDFAAKIDSITTIPALLAGLRAEVAPFGVTSLSVNLVRRPGGAFEPRGLFGEHWQHWSAVYVRSHFGAHDPAVRMLREQSRPFTWAEALARFRTPSAERVMDACREFTGGREGFVVPIPESDGALLTAAFSGPHLDLSPETRPVLTMVGYYFATRGRDLLEHVKLDPDVRLSQRQLEVLYWVRRGKTDGEIALILRISPRTVHNHIEAAKTILNTSKRGVAANEAWRRGWID